MKSAYQCSRTSFRFFSVSPHVPAASTTLIGGFYLMILFFLHGFGSFPISGITYFTAQWNLTGALCGLLSASENICCICSVFCLVGTRRRHCVVCCHHPEIYAAFASCSVWSEPDGYIVPLVYYRLPSRCVAFASCLVWVALCLVWFGFGVVSFWFALDLIGSVWVFLGLALIWLGLALGGA